MNPKIPTESIRVLVIDDDLSTRLMVREVLGPAGCVVEEAEGGRQGIALVQSFRPDIVLLDILMPEMDGFATLESLRAHEHGAACPVVMITGLQDPGAVETAFQLGATDFVTKPINWNLLRHRINYVMRASSSRPAGDRQPLEDALRLAGVGTWRWNPETDRVNASDRFLRLLGLPDGAPLVPRLVLDRVIRSDRRRFVRALRRSISANRTSALDVSFRVLAEGSGSRCVRARADAFQVDGGGVGLAGILQDISETTRLERELQDVHSLMRSVQQLFHEIPETSPVEASDASHRQIGLEPIRSD